MVVASVCCLDAIPTSMSNGCAADCDLPVLTSLYPVPLSSTRFVIYRGSSIGSSVFGGRVLVGCGFSAVWMPHQRRIQI